METWLQLLLLAIGLLLLFATGIPVAFGFAILNLIAAYILFGSTEALSFLVQAAFSSVSNVALTAVPFFLFMGIVFVRTGMSRVVLKAVETILFGVRSSGSYVAVGAGTLFGALMGASVASTAVLGSTLLTEMRQKGYSKRLSVGPILGAGTLSNLIPPSVGAVLIGGLGGISIGDLLVAGLGPAAVLIVLLCVYIFFTSWRERVPRSEGTRIGLGERVRAVGMLMPLAVPIFAVTGVIYLGIATPTEAAATGCAATLVVALFQRRMTWTIFKATLLETVSITAMIFLIVTSAKAYSQIIAMTGAAREISSLLADATSSPLVGVAVFVCIVLILGCFLDQASVIFIAIPLFITFLNHLKVDPVWFGILFSMAIGTGGITPPFGMNLFVLKGVAPRDISLGDIFRISLPFCMIEIVTISAVLFVPWIATVFIR